MGAFILFFLILPFSQTSILNALIIQVKSHSWFLLGKSRVLEILNPIGTSVILWGNSYLDDGLVVLYCRLDSTLSV